MSLSMNPLTSTQFKFRTNPTSPALNVREIDFSLKANQLNISVIDQGVVAQLFKFIAEVFAELYKRTNVALFESLSNTANSTSLNNSQQLGKTFTVKDGNQDIYDIIKNESLLILVEEHKLDTQEKLLSIFSERINATVQPIIKQAAEPTSTGTSSLDPLSLLSAAESASPTETPHFKTQPSLEANEEALVTQAKLAGVAQKAFTEMSAVEVRPEIDFPAYEAPSLDTPSKKEASFDLTTNGSSNSSSEVIALSKTKKISQTTKETGVRGSWKKWLFVGAVISSGMAIAEILKTRPPLPLEQPPQLPLAANNTTQNAFNISNQIATPQTSTAISQALIPHSFYIPHTEFLVAQTKLTDFALTLYRQPITSTLSRSEMHTPKSTETPWIIPHTNLSSFDNGNSSVMSIVQANGSRDLTNATQNALFTFTQDTGFCFETMPIQPLNGTYSPAINIRERDLFGSIASPYHFNKSSVLPSFAQAYTCLQNQENTIDQNHSVSTFLSQEVSPSHSTLANANEFTKINSTTPQAILSSISNNFTENQAESSQKKFTVLLQNTSQDEIITQLSSGIIDVENKKTIEISKDLDAPKQQTEQTVQSNASDASSDASLGIHNPILSDIETKLSELKQMKIECRHLHSVVEETFESLDFDVAQRNAQKLKDSCLDYIGFVNDYRLRKNQKMSDQLSQIREEATNLKKNLDVICDLIKKRRETWWDTGWKVYSYGKTIVAALTTLGALIATARSTHHFIASGKWKNKTERLEYLKTNYRKIFEILRTLKLITPDPTPASLATTSVVLPPIQAISSTTLTPHAHQTVALGLGLSSTSVNAPLESRHKRSKRKSKYSLPRPSRSNLSLTNVNNGYSISKGKQRASVSRATITSTTPLGTGNSFLSSSSVRSLTGELKNDHFSSLVGQPPDTCSTPVEPEAFQVEEPDDNDTVVITEDDLKFFNDEEDERKDAGVTPTLNAISTVHKEASETTSGLWEIISTALRLR